MHGLQTFLQLVELAPDGFVVPAISIQDQPRFPWRGVLIDVSRHFIPLDVLKRNLDGMAAVKMNVLHWHLSDNEGFRVESKRFPRLHQEGSEGLFYTRQEIRDFIAYAGDRGIRIVPEFDMPGHTRSFFVGYPELASAPGPYRLERMKDDQDPAMNPTLEKTYQFLDKFIGEMAELFPDPYFHIGGDELNGAAWTGNPKIQEFMRTHGMKSNQELQAYFNARLQKIVSKHGKTMMGWDEILQPDLPSSVVVQSWRGQDSLASAAKLGHPGVLSFGYYLDLMWPASRHYAIDPMADNAATLSSDEKRRILGGETCMWAEFVSPENIDSRIWPRAAAIAERLWSPQEVKDVPSMYQRLGEISWRLERLGLTHNASDIAAMQRMAGTNDIASLRVLAAVVEPVKDYTRMDSSPVIVTSKTPLNRLVDGVHPESDEARNFADLVNAFATSGYKDAASKARIRASLLAWRDNDARLQPLLQQSFLLKEVAPISQDLSALADAGLRALDYLERGETPPAPWRADQLARIEQAKKPKADLLLMVVPALQQLIEAPGNRTASGAE
jgi:hexosaminidase